jgi:hypothetical protein
MLIPHISGGNVASCVNACLLLGELASQSDPKGKDAAFLALEAATRSVQAPAARRALETAFARFQERRFQYWAEIVNLFVMGHEKGLSEGAPVTPVAFFGLCESLYIGLKGIQDSGFLADRELAAAAYRGYEQLAAKLAGVSSFTLPPGDDPLSRRMASLLAGETT